MEEKSFGYQFNFYLSTGEESIPAMGEINPKSGAWFRFFLEDSSTEIVFFWHLCRGLFHHIEREFHVSEQIQQVAIQYWVIAQTLVIFQTNLKGTAQLQLLQLLWPLGDVIFMLSERCRQYLLFRFPITGAAMLF